MSVIVVNQRFKETHAQALHHPAVNLAFDHQRIEGEADVLDGDVLLEAQLTRFTVYRDFNEVGNRAWRVLLHGGPALPDDRPRPARLGFGDGSQLRQLY